MKRALTIILFLFFTSILLNISFISSVGLNNPRLPSTNSVSVTIYHNDLDNIQGGSANEYYHLNNSIYNYLLGNIYGWGSGGGGNTTSEIWAVTNNNTFARYQFENNNFNGSGNITTSGRVTSDRVYTDVLSLTSHLVIGGNVYGHLTPPIDGVFNIGEGSYRWNYGYFNNIYSGMARYSVPYVSNAGGLIAGHADLTFDGTKLTVPNIIDSGLTAGRVVATDGSKNLVSISGTSAQFVKGDSSLDSTTYLPTSTKVGNTTSEIWTVANNNTFYRASNPNGYYNYSSNVTLNNIEALGDITNDVGIGATLTRNFATDGSTSRRVASFKRTYTGGVGADGIGAHVDFVVETETEGTLGDVGQIQFKSTDATAGTIDSDAYLSPYLNGVAVPFKFGSNGVFTTSGLNVTGNATIVGSLGVGITSPKTSLNVYGTSAGAISTNGAGSGNDSIFRVTGSATNVLDIGTLSVAPYSIFLQARDYVNNGYHYPLVLNPVGGNVSIGTTSTNVKFEVEDNQNGKRTGMVLDNTDQIMKLTNYYEGGVGAYSSIQSSNDAGTTPWYLLLNPDGGNVGINTTSPAYKLDVLKGDANGWVARISHQSGGSPGVLIGERGGLGSIGTVGAGALNLNPDGGRVGINAVPERTFDIGGTDPQIRVGAWTTISGDGGGFAIFGTNIYRNTTSPNFYYTNTHPSIGYAAMVNYFGDTHFISNVSATTKDASVVPQYRMTIKSSGFVGINDTTPSYPLEVNGLGSGGISVYSLGNVSASGYIDRTSIYDTSKGLALDKIKDVETYKYPNGTINHKAFYGFIEYNVEKCEGDNKNKTCQTVHEEGVSLGDEIALLRQSVYELKIQNEELKKRLEVLEGKTL